MLYNHTPTSVLQVGDEEREVVHGARMRDMLTGQEWDVRAKMVVNATGREGRERGRGERKNGRKELYETVHLKVLICSSIWIYPHSQSQYNQYRIWEQHQTQDTVFTDCGDWTCICGQYFLYKDKHKACT